jgi:hypothetical protein
MWTAKIQLTKGSVYESNCGLFQQLYTADISASSVLRHALCIMSKSGIEVLRKTKFSLASGDCEF